jgi:C-terminal processing protease CtpA/Prc
MGTVLRLPERFDPERAAAEGTGRRRTGVAIGLATRGGRTRIASVRPDSQAAIAGLRVGDVVETIDGEPAGDAAEAEALLRGPVGTEVLIEVRRAGRTEIIPVDREAYRAP